MILVSQRVQQLQTIVVDFYISVPTKILNKVIAKELAAFERNTLRRMFWWVKINENWRKLYHVELMQLFGDLNILSFVTLRQCIWTGHVNTMDSKRKVSKVFNNNLQGYWLRGRPKNRWWNCVEADINRSKIQNWKER